MSNDRVQRLLKYVAILEDRLARSVPPRHAHRPEAFKQMLETDLKKTKIALENLRR